MAQKLDVTMAVGKAEVSHLGKTVEVSLPDWFRAHASFYTEEALLNHCLEHEILLATLQAGMAQHLIEIRAKARPQPLPPTEKGGDPIPQEITTAGAQQRVNEYYPEARRPGEDNVAKAGKGLAKLKPEAQRTALKMAGFTDAQIDALMSATE